MTNTNQKADCSIFTLPQASRCHPNARRYVCADCVPVYVLTVCNGTITPITTVPVNGITIFTARAFNCEDGITRMAWVPEVVK